MRLIVILGLSILVGCTTADSLDSDPTKAWTSLVPIDELAGCVNLGFTRYAEERGGYPPSIETVVPDQIYRIATAAASYNAPRTWTVTIREEAQSRRVEYRSGHIHPERDIAIIEACLVS